MDYSRQKAVFDQAVLGSSAIAIAGSGNMADFMVLYAVGLGIGNIDIEKQGSGFLDYGIISRINPDVKITETKLEDSAAGVIADFTNSPESKENSCTIARKNKAAFISAASDGFTAKISVDYGKNRGNNGINNSGIISLLSKQGLFFEYRGKQQGVFTSSLIAAVALDEIRKVLLELPGDVRQNGEMRFSVLQKDHFSPKESLLEQIIANKSQKLNGKALVIGAGGIGTYVAINLAMLGIPFDIYDGDSIEDTNLNRQVLYYDAIGRNKADTLKERLQQMFNADITSFPRHFDESDFRKGDYAGYSAVFSCVDSREPRMMLNKYCLENNLLMIDAGVSPFTARLDAVNKNTCLECRRGNSEKQKKEAEGCAAAAESNVVMTNAFVGAMAVAELCAILAGTGNRNQLMYFSKKGIRDKTTYLGIEKQCSCSSEKACKCHARGGLNGI